MLIKKDDAPCAGILIPHEALSKCNTEEYDTHSEWALSAHDGLRSFISEKKPVSGGPEGNSSEDRFARQDSRRYSGWSSALAIAAIVIALGIVLIVYYVVH
jgi:hypothetical protein